jgi:hypothetical protein
VTAKVTALPGPAEPAETLGDAALLELSCRKPERFGEIYDRYIGEIHAYLGRRLDQQAADDLAAEVFLTAFRKRETFDARRGTDWLINLDRYVADRMTKLLYENPAPVKVRSAAFQVLKTTKGVSDLGRGRTRWAGPATRSPCRSWRRRATC